MQVNFKRQGVHIWQIKWGNTENGHFFLSARKTREFYTGAKFREQYMGFHFTVFFHKYVPKNEKKNCYHFCRLAYIISMILHGLSGIYYTFIHFFFFLHFCFKIVTYYNYSIYYQIKSKKYQTKCKTWKAKCVALRIMRNRIIINQAKWQNHFPYSGRTPWRYFEREKCHLN